MNMKYLIWLFTKSVLDGTHITVSPEPIKSEQQHLFVSAVRHEIYTKQTEDLFVLHSLQFFFTKFVIV
jgi:hypothetical protein